MSLQKLRIAVDETSHWYKVVKTFCLKDKHDRAAKYWLSRARTIWLANMHRRLDLIGPRVVVDDLFDEAFVDTLHALENACKEIEQLARPAADAEGE
jgi:hypothetical protein